MPPKKGKIYVRKLELKYLRTALNYLIENQNHYFKLWGTPKSVVRKIGEDLIEIARGLKAQDLKK